MIFTFFGIKDLIAQSQKKVEVQKTVTEVKSVPSAIKKNTVLKSAQRQAITAHKQQIKKAIRRTNMTKRPIRRR